MNTEQTQTRAVRLPAYYLHNKGISTEHFYKVRGFKIIEQTREYCVCELPEGWVLGRVFRQTGFYLRKNNKLVAKFYRITDGLEVV